MASRAPCPVCGQEVYEALLDQHVNMCLDRQDRLDRQEVELGRPLSAAEAAEVGGPDLADMGMPDLLFDSIGAPGGAGGPPRGVPLHHLNSLERLARLLEQARRLSASGAEAGPRGELERDVRMMLVASLAARPEARSLWAAGPHRNDGGNGEARLPRPAGDLDRRGGAGPGARARAGSNSHGMDSRERLHLFDHELNDRERRDELISNSIRFLLDVPEPSSPQPRFRAVVGLVSVTLQASAHPRGSVHARMRGVYADFQFDERRVEGGGSPTGRVALLDGRTRVPVRGLPPPYGPADPHEQPPVAPAGAAGPAGANPSYSTATTAECPPTLVAHWSGSEQLPVSEFYGPLHVVVSLYSRRRLRADLYLGSAVVPLADVRERSRARSAELFAALRACDGEGAGHLPGPNAAPAASAGHGGDARAPDPPASKRGGGGGGDGVSEVLQAASELGDAVDDMFADLERRHMLLGYSLWSSGLDLSGSPEVSDIERMPNDDDDDDAAPDSFASDSSRGLGAEQWNRPSAGARRAAAGRAASGADRDADAPSAGARSVSSASSHASVPGAAYAGSGSAALGGLEGRGGASRLEGRGLGTRRQPSRFTGRWYPLVRLGERFRARGGRPSQAVADADAVAAGEPTGHWVLLDLDYYATDEMKHKPQSSPLSAGAPNAGSRRIHVERAGSAPLLDERFRPLSRRIARRRFRGAAPELAPAGASPRFGLAVSVNPLSASDESDDSGPVSVRRYSLGGSAVPLSAAAGAGASDLDDSGHARPAFGYSAASPSDRSALRRFPLGGMYPVRVSASSLSSPAAGFAPSSPRGGAAGDRDHRGEILVPVASRPEVLPRLRLGGAGVSFRSGGGGGGTERRRLAHPLLRAVASGSARLVEEVLGAGGGSHLMVEPAGVAGTFHAVALLRHGAKVAETLVRWRSARDRVPPSGPHPALARDQLGRTPVHYAVWAAARRGPAGVTRRALRTLGVVANAGVVDEPDAAGQTPLMLACSMEAAEVAVGLARELLRLGASPERVGPRGQSVVHVAARMRNEPLVRLLAKAAPMMLDHPDEQGETALLAAVRARDVDIVRLLLSLGARQAPAAGFRWTPLHAAAEQGLSSLAVLLVNSLAPAEVGPALRRTDSAGRSPLDLASSGSLAGHRAILSLFEFNLGLGASGGGGVGDHHAHAHGHRPLHGTAAGLGAAVAVAGGVRSGRASSTSSTGSQPGGPRSTASAAAAAAARPLRPLLVQDGEYERRALAHNLSDTESDSSVSSGLGKPQSPRSDVEGGLDTFHAELAVGEPLATTDAARGLQSSGSGAPPVWPQVTAAVTAVWQEATASLRGVLVMMAPREGVFGQGAYVCECPAASCRELVLTRLEHGLVGRCRECGLAFCVLCRARTSLTRHEQRCNDVRSGSTYLHQFSLADELDDSSSENSIARHYWRRHEILGAAHEAALRLQRATLAQSRQEAADDYLVQRLDAAATALGVVARTYAELQAAVPAEFAFVSSTVASSSSSSSSSSAAATAASAAAAAAAAAAAGKGAATPSDVSVGPSPTGEEMVAQLLRVQLRAQQVVDEVLSGETEHLKRNPTNSWAPDALPEVPKLAANFTLSGLHLAVRRLQTSLARAHVLADRPASPSSA